MKIACLGGAGEIGMNLYVYETEHAAVMVDYGVMFTDNCAYGVDYTLPDISYLHKIQGKLKALLVSHGHEDHIGGVRDMIEHFDLPIYTGRFTAELIGAKTALLKQPPRVTVINPLQKYDFDGITAVFFPVKHSVPDTYGIVLDFGEETALHLSDFSGGKNAVLLPAVLKEKKVTALLLDSTNADNLDENPHTEATVAEELIKILSESERRVFFTTFASNVERIGAAMAAAVRTGRKVVVEGAAMGRTVGIALRLGLLSLPEHMLITAKQARSEPPRKLLYIVSGCQGEYGGALCTISSGGRTLVKMEEGDTLIFSSRVIPGNEKNINGIVNDAMRKNVRVIQAHDRPVHVSGHADAPALEALIRAVQPEYFIPIHGEYRHMAASARVAGKAGVDRERIIVIESGDRLVFFSSGVHRERENVSPRYFDSRGGFILDEGQYVARKQIGRDGLVIVHMGEKIGIDTVGFPFTPEDEKAILSAVSRSDGESPEAISVGKIRRLVGRYYKKYMGRRPVIVIYKNGKVEK